MRTKHILSPATAILIATPVLADQLFNENVTVVAPQICVGTGCFENIGNISTGEGVRVRADSPRILFEDTSTSQSNSRDDWQISINDAITLNSEEFGIENLSNSTVPFLIEGPAPTAAFYVAGDGDIGLGTTLPEADLHVVNPVQARVILETTGAIEGKWALAADENGSGIIDLVTGDIPFAMLDGAPSFSLLIGGNGYVGLGTDNPSAPFEVYSGNSFNFFRITAADATNDSVDITYTGGPLGTGQLRYNIVDGDNQEMSLDANGNMVLDGTLTTAGPTCAGGCDRVFDADYELPSISEHADQMFAAGYLPGIGATVPHAPVNLSERQGGIINALEHAHLYINQLHLEAKADRAVIETLSRDMAALRKELETLRAQ